MINKIYKYYDVFYDMVLSSTIMSNARTPELEADTRKIIEYIGKAYKLDENFITYCQDIILGELMTLALTVDQQAIYSSREYGYTYSDKDILYDIKGDVLNRLQEIGRRDKEISGSWFDYSHYKTYQANIRYSKINATSASGNLIATRQSGILRVLGIGCNVDMTEGIKRLSQCMFWGDMTATNLLAYAYLLANDISKSNMFYELAELLKKYLYAGYTVLPETAKKEYSDEARTHYIYISTIKQDIIYAYNKYNIDFSFIEAITSGSLSYFDKMYHINNYDKKAWKDITNSSEKPASKLGFK